MLGWVAFVNEFAWGFGGSAFWFCPDLQVAVPYLKNHKKLVKNNVLNGLQARKLLRELKHLKRCNEAATVISAYWHGTQVRKWQQIVLLCVPTWNEGYPSG